MIIRNNIDIEKLYNKYEKEKNKFNDSGSDSSSLCDFQCFLNELYNSTNQPTMNVS